MGGVVRAIVIRAAVILLTIIPFLREANEHSARGVDRLSSFCGFMV